jgi:hypothetical protein
MYLSKYDGSITSTQRIEYYWLRNYAWRSREFVTWNTKTRYVELNDRQSYRSWEIPKAKRWPDGDENDLIIELLLVLVCSFGRRPGTTRTRRRSRCPHTMSCSNRNDDMILAWWQPATRVVKRGWRVTAKRSWGRTVLTRIEDSWWCRPAPAKTGGSATHARQGGGRRQLGKVLN